MCRACLNTKVLPIHGGFSSITLPRSCDNARDVDGSRNKCPMDPFVIVHDKCKFVDSQVIKLQEAPDMVPVGDLPRHIILNADRWLTNRVVPGMRAVVMGIYSIYQSKSNVSIFVLELIWKTKIYYRKDPVPLLSVHLIFESSALRLISTTVVVDDPISQKQRKRNSFDCLVSLICITYWLAVLLHPFLAMKVI